MAANEMKVNQQVMSIIKTLESIEKSTSQGASLRTSFAGKLN